MAEQCKEILQKKVEDEFFFKQVSLEETAIKEKLSEVIVNMDKQLAFEGKCDYKTSGCTLTLVLYFNGAFFVANVGAAHCLYASARDNRHSSRGNVSSAAGSEIFKMSNASGVSGMTSKTATFATTNPTKAVAFLYKATQDLTTNLYGGKFGDFSLGDSRSAQMDIVTTEHSVTNYEELLRISQAGGVVCKDHKKGDLPFFAKPFKLYMDPTTSHPGVAQTGDWPGIRVSRYCARV